MPKLRSIVDALVDLGEKVTGKPIEVQDKDLMVYGEDVTEVIDEITKNYEGGGSGTESISTFTLHWDGEKVVDDAMPITNEDEIAILEQIRQDYLESGKMPVAVSIIGGQERSTNRYLNHNFSISYGTFALEGGEDFCMYIEPFGFEYDGSVRYIGLNDGTWEIYGVWIE